MFIAVGHSFAAFLTGFDFFTLYKVGLYWGGEGKRYLKIDNKHSVI